MGSNPTDGCLHEKRRLGHTDRHEGRVCTEGELCEEGAGGGPAASHGERAQKNLPRQPLDFGFLACEKIHFLLFKPLSLL